MKALPAGKEAGGEVARSASDDSIKFHNDLGVEVMFAMGQLPDFVFEFLHRFRSHTSRTRGDKETQEGITLTVGNYLRFGRTQREAELIQDRFDEGTRLFGPLIGIADNDKIVGITNKSKAGMVKLPIHVIEYDISQKGRDDSALRGADRSRLEDAVLHYSGLEKFFDKPENIAIGNFLSHRVHDDVMPEIVKKSGYVGVKHEAQPAAMESNKGVESLMGVSILNVSEG